MEDVSRFFFIRCSRCVLPLTRCEGKRPTRLSVVQVARKRDRMRSTAAANFSQATHCLSLRPVSAYDMCKCPAMLDVQQPQSIDATVLQYCALRPDLRLIR